MEIKPFLDPFWRSSCQLMRKPRMQCLEENNGTLQNPFVRFSYNDSDGSLSWTSWTPKRHLTIKAPLEKACGDLNVKTASGRMDLMDHDSLTIGAKTRQGKKSQTPSENNLLGWRRIFVPWLPWWQFNRMTGYTSQVPCHVLLGLWLCSINVLRFDWWRGKSTYTIHSSRINVRVILHRQLLPWCHVCIFSLCESHV